MGEVGAELGEHGVVQPGCVVGLEYREGCAPAKIGTHAVLRSGTIIYGDVSIGDYFQSGHHSIVREHSRIGNHVSVGTSTSIEGGLTIGDFVKIAQSTIIGPGTNIGTRVFIGPGVIMINDRYPLKMRDRYRPTPNEIEDGVTIGAGVILTPGIRVGEGSFVASGAVVVKDVPPMSMVIGVPGRVSELPEELRERNTALSWQPYLEGGSE